ncbi:hypothetical protein Q5P01_014136 [Channa striata]|uniref:Olfactory receptor n=1 Tax=Channa striata TaxID=64152 RepID=A0AA88MLT5_CHASR|nr:hypothetical protein Q5P01_014136 [Channa striata]
MDDSLNLTYITLDGFVDLHTYKYLYFVIMFTVYVLIVCCNSTIVCLIVIHPNLHEPMYIFIAALLINSVLYSTNIYPKLLIDFLSEKQVVSYSACLFQAFINYTLVFAEFLLLAAMSYDRYVSICKPLRYPAIMRKTTVSIFLVLSWILPVCGLTLNSAFNAKVKFCTFILKGMFCNNSIYKIQCVISRAQLVYGAAMFLSIALFPTLFILFTYTKILVICYRSCKSVKRKAAQTCLHHLLVLINFSCLVIYDVVIVRLELDFPETAHLIMTLQVIVYHPLLNPVIYGLKMREISKHLNSLLSQIKPH